MPTQKPTIQFELELAPNSKQIGVYGGVEYEIENTTDKTRYFCIFGPEKLAEQKDEV